MQEKKVVARLTIIRNNGLRTIVEVEAQSTFSSFYRFYRQQGAKRSTKESIRIANRNEGVGFGQKLGLEAIAAKLEMYASQSNPVVSKRLRIIKKRAYRKLISARPDELGLAHTRVNLPMERVSPLSSIQVPALVSVR